MEWIFYICLNDLFLTFTFRNDLDILCILNKPKNETNKIEFISIICAYLFIVFLSSVFEFYILYLFD